MKDTSSHSKLVKSKPKHNSSDSSESSDSETETVPVIKYKRENDSGGSNTDDSSIQDSRKMKKRKHHHHHHHHHHRRKHKLIEGEKVRYDERERFEDHPSLRHSHSSHRRHGEERIRLKTEENPQYSGSSSRHRHRDDSEDGIRHHRKREGESHHRRDELSRVKKPSAELEERDQMNSRRERRGETREYRERGSRNGEQNPIPADRPIKQEQGTPEPDYQWGKQTNTAENKNDPPADKAKPNFGLSGKLAEETNTFNGVVLKYSEPQEARKPKRRWRFYPFKGDAGLPILYLHRQSCYLIGRDRKVADIPVDHPSCSKQHAALQYRLAPYKRDDGSTGRRVRPYIIDLESANGTYVNNNKIEPKKYVELLEKDVVKFGYSSREYVLLHEHSKDDDLDDDIVANE
ncbi:hypothetical protein R5R35_014229 [Gryllus longicercus]|uniref:FHA domain-containing protein n=1 Tax=Gryllus longicercus TaxID=2509291 RepID=A0AAN9ZBN5_9ORTH